MGTKKVALQLYTLRSLLKTPSDIRETFKNVKAIGYDAVQVSGLGPIETNELKDILTETGLYPCSVHRSYEALLKEPEKILQECKLIGYETVACHSLNNELHNVQGFKTAAKELTKVGKYFFENGIILVYHNHAFEFEKFNRKTGLEILLEESDPKYLQTELDTYWIQYGGGDPVEWLLKYKDRAPIVHLKYMGIIKDKQVMREIGEGNLNWEAIFKTLKSMDTRWYAIEQDDTNGVYPLESVKISLNNLKKMEIE